MSLGDQTAQNAACSSSFKNYILIHFPSGKKESNLFYPESISASFLKSTSSSLVQKAAEFEKVIPQLQSTQSKQFEIHRVEQLLWKERQKSEVQSWRIRVILKKTKLELKKIMMEWCLNGLRNAQPQKKLQFVHSILVCCMTNRWFQDQNVIR